MFYEVIYEGGAHSIMEVDDEGDALDALTEQHRRAKEGEMGGPAGDRSAERVVRVLVYDKHPNDYNLEQVVTSDELTAALKDYVKGKDVVPLQEALAELRDLSSPTVVSGPHESNYKMEQSSELKAVKWGGE